MNLIRRGLSLVSSSIRQHALIGGVVTKPFPQSSLLSVWPVQPLQNLVCSGSTLAQMHRRGPHKKDRPSKNPLNGNPFAKGIVLKTLIKKPKKPNSANRKCVMVRLSNGKEMVAYIPGIGHNLQEHNVVLVRVGKLKDCPGVKLKCVRGKYDLAHVVKPTT